MAALLQQRLKAVVESTAVAHNCTATVELDDSYPSIINSETTTPIVSAVATKLLGPSRVVGDVGGGMPGAEDFSYVRCLLLGVCESCSFSLGFVWT